MSKLYSLNVSIKGTDGKERNRELGIATPFASKNGGKPGLTVWLDLMPPVDPATGRPLPIFLREIERKQEPAPVQQELELAGSPQ